MSQTEARTDRLKAAHDKLQAAVESIVSADDWQRMLRTAAKFQNYSFNNQLLIFLQCPDATHVAGFHRWKSLGRTVKKGEKGIQIFAACKYRTKIEGENGDEQSLQQVRGFRVAYVFDISQTEGEPLRDLDAVRPKILDGPAPEGIWDALVAQAKNAGFEVIRETNGRANGYCDFVGKKIAVRPEVSEAQAFKTLVHELGHALLHADKSPKTAAIAEVEVESVAYIVCDALSLDSSSYSFSYVTRWGNGDLDLVKETAQRSISCAARILKTLEVRSSVPVPAG